MDRNRRTGTALIGMLLLALLISSQLRASPAAPWQFRLEFASVRLSITSGEAPVQNRTALFDIGQSLLRAVIAR